MQIGPYRIENPLALAPMVGVTDRFFRQLCRELGAGYLVTEMLAANPALRNTRTERLRGDFAGEASPIAVQIAGSDPLWMADAARYNVARGAQIIDINMGCPSKKVCNKLAGSALLSDPDQVSRILNAVVSAVDVPVTLKIRTGPNPQQRNGLEIAQLAEQSGIAALAVHGRTRSDRFTGQVEYATIRDICDSVSIPVFANGDIATPQKAAEVLAFTAADGLIRPLKDWWVLPTDYEGWRVRGTEMQIKVQRPDRGGWRCKACNAFYGDKPDVCVICAGNQVEQIESMPEGVQGISETKSSAK